MLSFLFLSLPTKVYIKLPNSASNRVRSPGVGALKPTWTLTENASFPSQTDVGSQHVWRMRK